MGDDRKRALTFAEFVGRLKALLDELPDCVCPAGQESAPGEHHMGCPVRGDLPVGPPDPPAGMERFA